MKNILILYYYHHYPMRVSSSDHLYSFGRYGNVRCCYVNLAARNLPSDFFSRPFDAVIFHTHFLARRWRPDNFAELRRIVSPLAKRNIPKIALPQDDYFRSDDLCSFFHEIGITHIFTVTPPSEWDKVYPGFRESGVHMEEVLTGYLDDKTLNTINTIMRENDTRTVDVGYRAWKAAYWLGRHGQKKVEVADRFQEACLQAGLKPDISLRLEDTFLGNAWYQFLARCNATIGVEGGASILDRDGSLQIAVDAYCAAHPEATFDEVEEQLFPGRDGELWLFAISPRHLEACATKTCQLLISGRYNGVLKAGEHFIEVQPDFSNLHEALAIAADPVKRVDIVERAYRDVVQSGAYRYESFVHRIFSVVFGAEYITTPRTRRFDMGERLASLLDKLAWGKVAIRFWYRFRLPELWKRNG